MVAMQQKSKKLSDANSNSLPNDLIFFIDCSLGKQIVPNMLRAAGAKVIAHDEVFPQGTKDEEWLSEAGKKGWIVLTKDKRIRYHINEINMLVRAKVAAIVLASRGDLQGKEMGEIFCRAIPSILRLCKKVSRPFIANLSKDGSLQQMYPKKTP